MGLKAHLLHSSAKANVIQCLCSCGVRRIDRRRPTIPAETVSKSVQAEDTFRTVGQDILWASAPWDRRYELWKPGML